MDQFKDILKVLKKLQDQQYQLINIIESMTSEPSSGIVSSAYDFLFERENNDYDREYSDYISNCNINIKELTIQERLSEREATIQALYDKQQDQDKLINRLSALSTRLETRIIN
ncbi:hypothetical protein ACFYU8_14820 [Brevibacillus sp. NPDC003359]|uniref:hypothetical protein n=1 Tax=unclassified Brevibacillus TaxID=2684853 RepID=UPI0036820601